MAGSISLSGAIQLDSQGRPLSGGKLYTIEAGTTATPQSAYSDSGLTLALPNPMECDASGRLPFFYLADGNIKVRLTDKAGVQVLVQDNLLVVGASSGSGSGDTVDDTTILATGDIKVRYDTGTLDGFVRGNGRTIGSATSGGTERANADCQALFEHLWGADSNLTVSSGRGSTASDDWDANKTIALPDFRGRIMAALDDMGNTAAGRITTAGSNVDGSTLGASGGAQTVTIAQTNLPDVDLASTDLSADGTITTIHNWPNTSVADGAGGLGVVRAVNEELVSDVDVSISGTVPLGGSGTALNKMPPVIMITTYIKL